MITPKLIFKILPWFLLIVIVLTLFLTNYSPFASKEKQEVIDSSVILREVENIGRLELVKYNFKEIFDYKRLSDGKLVGNTLFRTYNYAPDLNVVLVAAGEAVGCIDLTKLAIEDINLKGDTLTILLPAPELCYHKVDLENTRIYSLKNNSWWSNLFSDEDEHNEVIQMAYQQTEKRIAEAAYESGILKSTNDQAVQMLKPMLESMTGRTVNVVTTLPEVNLIQSK